MEAVLGIRGDETTRGICQVCKSDVEITTKGVEVLLSKKISKNGPVGGIGKYKLMEEKIVIRGYKMKSHY